MRSDHHVSEDASRLSVVRGLILAVWVGLAAGVAAEPAPSPGIVELKVFSQALATPGSAQPKELALAEIIKRFEQLHPEIRVSTSEGLRIQGKGDEMAPLMQIAADISPDVIYVNFRKSESYIEQGFLLPLDRFVDRLSAEEIAARVPSVAWPVLKRPGPDGKTHTWAWPTGTQVTALNFRKDIFRAAGLDPARGPRDWAELDAFCQKIRAACPDKFGMGFEKGSNEPYKFLSFLWSAGGEVMQEVRPGDWRVTFDSDEAIEAFAFYYKLVKSGCVYRGGDVADLWKRGKIGMTFAGLGDNLSNAMSDPVQWGFSPVPFGPTGKRGNEVNCPMMGIYAGVKDPRRQEAAWDFIRFYDSNEARAIHTRVLVESGLASQVNPRLLREFGFGDFVQDAPPEWVEVQEQAMTSGKPEPYGKNANLIYREMAAPMDQMFYDTEIARCWRNGDNAALKRRLKVILSEAVKRTNERIVGYIPPETRTMRLRVAGVVASVVVLAFAFLFRYLWNVFTPVDPGERNGSWQFRRHWFAYLILLPALGTILLWHYVPLARGTAMAFQNYKIMGGSAWVGLDNFALVLFDPTFWNALWVTCRFTFWTLTLGFFAPVFLAILLQEVPRGKVFFRTLFFLPHVLSGLIVIFLWRSFYSADGLVNTLLGWIGISHRMGWLDEPGTALVACVLPGIWAGMGTGSLIYLAALKSIPDDLYEAGDLDGATFFGKIRHVVLPGLKPLLIINFIGAFAGAFHASANILVMTGGGPYTPYGATEVTSLLIYYNAFLYLRFGFATAMAWTLGAMLIGFTVLQLKRLSRMEFKTTRADV